MSHNIEKMTMKRNHILQIRLSQEEFEQLKKKAEQSGLSVSSLVRFLILKSKVNVEAEQ